MKKSRKPKLKNKQQTVNFNKILTKDLYWLAPYLEAVQDDIPFKNIKLIDYYKTRAHQQKQNHLAITHLLGNNKTYKIYIRTSLPKEKRIPLDYDTQEDVLWFVAHELAHVVHWEHGPEHFHCMTKLFSKFGDVLINIGFEKDRNKRT